MNLTQRESELELFFGDIENAVLCERCGKAAQDEHDLDIIDGNLLCSDCYADDIEEAIYQRGLRETRRSMGVWGRGW